MNTINFEDLRAILNTIRQEEADLLEEDFWTDDYFTYMNKEMSIAELSDTVSPDMMEALYQANDAAYAYSKQVSEQLEAIQAVRRAFEQAAKMLTDYMVDYGENND